MKYERGFKLRRKSEHAPGEWEVVHVAERKELGTKRDKLGARLVGTVSRVFVPYAGWLPVAYWPGQHPPSTAWRIVGRLCRTRAEAAGEVVQMSAIAASATLLPVRDPKLAAFSPWAFKKREQADW